MVSTVILPLTRHIKEEMVSPNFFIRLFAGYSTYLRI